MATRGREGEEDVEDVALLRNGGESRHAKPRNKYFVILPFEMYAVLSSHTNLSLQYNITLVTLNALRALSGRRVTHSAAIVARSRMLSNAPPQVLGVFVVRQFLAKDASEVT